MTTPGRGDRHAHLLRNAGKAPGTAYPVAHFLIMRGDENGRSWFGTKTIADAIGVDSRSVRRAFDTLEKAGLLANRGTNGRVTVREICPGASPGELLGTPPTGSPQADSSVRMGDEKRTAASASSGHERPHADGSGQQRPSKRTDASAQADSSVRRVHVQVHSENTPDGTVRTNEAGGHERPAPKGGELRCQNPESPLPPIAEVEARNESSASEFFQRIGLSQPGDRASRFAIEFGRGLDDWTDPTATLEALWKLAKRESSVSPHGLFRSWVTSRKTWAAKLTHVGEVERHAEAKSRNRVDPDEPHGEPRRIASMNLEGIYG